MGKAVPEFGRPLQLRNGLETRGSVVFSTGGKKVDYVQTLTGASTGTTITNYGITTIAVTTAAAGTAANLVFTLAAPVAGVEKIIAVRTPTTKEVQVRTPSSAAAHNFFGSTFNALLWSTQGASTNKQCIARLHGVSTSQWVVEYGSGIIAQGATA